MSGTAIAVSSPSPGPVGCACAAWTMVPARNAAPAMKARAAGSRESVRPIPCIAAGGTRVRCSTQPESASDIHEIFTHRLESTRYSCFLRQICVRFMCKLWRSSRRSAQAFRLWVGTRNKIAGLGIVNVGIGAALPGMVASCQIGDVRRRIGVAPSNARAGNGPSATIRRGAASTISRCKNGKYVAISAGLGGRSPGGRHGINGAREKAPRSTPTLRSIRSRYAPTWPENRLPERSESALGASPTNSRPDAGSPSTNSILVAVSRSALPLKSAIAARSSSSVFAAAAARAARSIGVSRPATGATGADRAGDGAGRAGDADDTDGGRTGGGRNRSTGSASSASLAPHSICSRSAVNASIIRASITRVRCPSARFCATATRCLVRMSHTVAG
jgi:hypothetical protein